MAIPTMKDTPGWHGEDRPLRVLIVDDEPSFREYVGRFLSREGAEIQSAANGREAIAIAEVFQPDVLLADWVLRCDMHGIELGHLLRARWPNLRLVLMTGCPTIDLEAATQEGAIHGYIEKPFSLEDLGEGIRAVLV